MCLLQNFYKSSDTVCFRTTSLPSVDLLQRSFPLYVLIRLKLNVCFDEKDKEPPMTLPKTAKFHTEIDLKTYANGEIRVQHNQTIDLSFWQPIIHKVITSQNKDKALKQPYKRSVSWIQSEKKLPQVYSVIQCGPQLFIQELTAPPSSSEACYSVGSPITDLISSDPRTKLFFRRQPKKRDTPRHRSA